MSGALFIQETYWIWENSLANKINPIVYILIEISLRELDSKLLTALFLIKKGFRVIVGFQWELTENRDCLPTGIFFFKGRHDEHKAGADASMHLKTKTGSLAPSGALPRF